MAHSSMRPSDTPSPRNKLIGATCSDSEFCLPRVSLIRIWTCSLRLARLLSFFSCFPFSDDGAVFKRRRRRSLLPLSSLYLEYGVWSGF